MLNTSCRAPTGWSWGGFSASPGDLRVTNEEVNALSTLADIYTNTEAVDACISPTVLADCAPIIQKLFDPNDVEISHEFRILMSEDPSHETLQEEPSVKYLYAYRHCHVVFWRRLANRVVLLLL